MERDRPVLDGVLETEPAVSGRFTQDFGRLVEATPHAVLRAGSVDDVVVMVRYARRQGLAIAVNGQGGTADERESHSTFGQALVPGGISIDARSLATIHGIDGIDGIEGGTADVDCGVTWAELTDAALAGGRTPPMLTDFVHLSVGGTLSMGGIGGTMQHVGAQVDNVVELQVVTGEGELVTCSPRQHPALFEAVLGGAGQCGIIVRAKLSLVPAPTHALVLELFYDDLDAYLSDQLRLLRDGRFHYQEGQIVRRPDDAGWRYMVEAAAYFTPPAVPDRKALLAGLADTRAEAVITQVTYREWVRRVDVGMVELRQIGAWPQPHPWITLFVPASSTAELIRWFVAELQPADLGAGLITFFPFSPRRLKAPLFVVPRSGAEAFQLSVLRFPLPGRAGGEPAIDRMLAQNRALHDRAVERGGKRYLIGSIPDTTADDWRLHYGDLWPRFQQAKHRYDPDGILTPGQGIFPASAGDAGAEPGVRDGGGG
jgi:FAD/FMN-containing dehydrogenase